MKIDQAKIEIRPRTAWEAIDLGILLGRHHLSLLVRTWFVAFFPIYLILLYFLWESPSWILFIVWWLKPVFDRVPLYVLSRAIFEPPPTVKETTIDWWKNLRFHLFGDLIFRRLSPVRSYLLPIYQLERTSRKFATKRKSAFLGADSKAGWLSLTFIHIESFLTMGVLAFIYFMIPGYSLWRDFDLFNPFDFDFEGTFFLIYHCWAFVYFCVLSLTESLYVACGFSLYLNRRIIYEGWDLELGFKRLVKRLSSALVFVVALSISLMTLSMPTHAQTLDAPYQERQLEAKQTIKSLLDATPFREVSEKRTWQRKHVEEKTEKKQETVDKLKEEKAEEIALDMSSMSGAASLMGNLTQVFIWGVVIVVVALLIWYGKEMLPMFQGQRAERLPKQTIERFRGHEITPETLPDDILTAFEKAWQEGRREALGLLYRYLISELVHRYHIPLKESHTENEVIRLTLSLHDDGLTEFTQMMTKFWQYVAYGGYELSETDKDELLTQWRAFLVAKQDKGSTV